MAAYNMQEAGAIRKKAIFNLKDRNRTERQGKGIWNNKDRTGRPDVVKLGISYQNRQELLFDIAMIANEYDGMLLPCKIL